MNCESCESRESSESKSGESHESAESRANQGAEIIDARASEESQTTLESREFSNLNHESNAESRADSRDLLQNSRDSSLRASRSTQNDKIARESANPNRDSTPKIRFHYLDISRDFDFEFRESDVVILLAARAYAPKPPIKPFSTRNLKDYFYAVNVDGTRRVVEKMLANGCKNLIFFSTDMVYGAPQSLPVRENHARNPLGFYGASKVAAEDFIFKMRARGLNASIFRPRLIVGAGRFGILTKLFALIARDLPVPLIGSGANCYQMISVNDCASAILRALRAKIPNAEFNLGSHNPPCVRELLSAVIRAANSKSRLIPTHAASVKAALRALEFLGVPLMFSEQFKIADLEYRIDISRARSELGWEPKFGDEEMLFSAYKTYLAR